MPRNGTGRKKVDIVKIENEKSLQVTFSKRRAGLFKKASELCIMCGAEIAIVGYSPANKVYSFGHPCVDKVVDRFLRGNNPNPPHDTNVSDQLIEAYQKDRICKVNSEMNKKEEMLDTEIKRRDALKGIRRDTASGQRWWEAPIEELNFLQLKEIEKALKVINEKVEKEAQRQQMIHGTILPFSILGSCLTPTGSMENS